MLPSPGGGPPGLRARAASGAPTSRPRGPAAALLALALVAVALAAHALAPYLFGHVTLQNELAVQLKATSGLRIVARHARFVLFPRPRVVADAVRVDDPSGAVTLDADGMAGEVRLLPLVVGRVELSGAALLRPRIAIDLAAGPIRPDSTIGRALRGRDERGDGTPQRLGSLTLRDGSLRIARNGAPVLVLPSLDAAIEWSDLDAAASLTGSLRLAGERVDVALWLGSPSALPRGDASDIVLHAHSTSLDLTAKGGLTVGMPAPDAPGTDAATGEAAHDRAKHDGANATLGFKGHLSLEAASLGVLLARAAPGLALPAAFADASLHGQARGTADRDGLAAVDLQKLAFRADGNDWEGTLAFRRGARPRISATLASERLVLAPFTAALPAPFDAERRWSRAALPRLRIGDADLDLRVSAAHFVCRPLTIEDAALAVISRNGRLEIALIDGRLATGTLKARVSLGQQADALDLRGSASLSGADASALSWDAAGRQLATGTLSGSLGAESRGNSIASLIDNLSGSVGASLADGEVVGFGDAGGRTAVRSVEASARLAGGLATIGEATLSGPGLALSGRGTLDLRTGMLDLRGLRSGIGGDPAARSAIAVGGPLDDLTVGPVAVP